MYKLAAEAEIGAQISGLENAVRTGRPEAVELGQKLYGELFGQLDPESVAKTSWLLSLEGTLFATPFAALVTERKDGTVEYLVSQHSVQTIPGALLLSTRPEVGTGWFLGVGDPIYNVADPRWEGPKAAWLVSLFQSGPRPQFGRLVGSAQELSGSASNWAGTGTVLLEGSSARRDPFLKKLDQAPVVVHLATHVVDCGTQACLAFGLGANGASEFLSTTEVAALRVSGTLVAMTGCDSASGEVRAGSGLQGLTRAWQMAGASAVLATSWPVRDTNGEIFSSFYKYLRRVPAAEALRLSQLEMVHSGTWRAAPAYWAAYQISGGSR
jgi:CHAT domain-containing protein